jgi:DNA-binding transcriptional ArsR family regulator
MKTSARVATLERVGRALSDGTRARILVVLADGPAYPAALADKLGTTRANISNHLTCLRGCGLVKAVAEGRNVRYELADERMGDVLHRVAEVAVSEYCDDCDGRRRRSA